MVDVLKRQLEAARERLHERKAELDRAHQRIMDADPADETVDVDGLQAEFDQAAAAFDEEAAEVERCRVNLADAERREQLVRDNPQPEPRHASPRGSLRSELVYRPDDPTSWQRMISDLYAAQFGVGGEASERVVRSNREQNEILRDRSIQLRDVGTSAFAGLTVPQFLIDDYAPFLRAGRPVANMVQSRPLPEKGMVLSISRLTTGTGVAAQANENDAVQETNEDDTKLDVNVRTYAGKQDVSRQALERSEGVEEITFGDLAAAYASKLDSGIINDDGTNGTHLGIRSTTGIVAVTYTDASPTLAELYPKGADAMGQINGGIFTGATAWVMHSRRWSWFTAALDSANRPLVSPDANGPHNALAVGSAGDYGQVVGHWHGKPIVLDDNLPTNLGGGTNEDVILGLRSPELILWEEGDGAPRKLRFEQTLGDKLTVTLVVYGYSAFTAGRYPKAAATIGGSGLVTPSL